MSPKQQRNSNPVTELEKSLEKLRAFTDMQYADDSSTPVTHHEAMLTVKEIYAVMDDIVRALQKL